MDTDQINNINRSIVALRDQLREKKKAPPVKVPLGNGILFGERCGYWIYDVACNAGQETRVEDLEISIHCNGHICEGLLLGFDDQKRSAVIASKQNLGDKFKKTIVYADSKQIDDALTRNLDALISQSGKEECEPDRLLQSLFGAKGTKPTSWPSLDTNDLDSNQLSILESIQEHAVTFVDATSNEQISDLVDGVAQLVKRTLIIAPSSLVLDRLIYDLLRPADLSSTKRPRLLRTGCVASHDLWDEFGDEINVDRIVDKRLIRLAESRKQSNSRAQELRDSLRQIERVQALFAETKDLQAQVARLDQELRPLEFRVRDFQEELNKGNRIVEKISAELEKLKRMSSLRRMVKRVRPEDLVRKLKNVDAVRQRIVPRLEALKVTVAEKRQARDDATLALQEIAQLTTHVSEIEVTELFGNVEKELAEINRRLDLIASKRSRSCAGVEKDAIIVGSTLMEFLRNPQFSQPYDLIVLVEAEKLTLAEVSAVVPAAQEKIVLWGDFKGAKGRDANDHVNVLDAIRALNDKTGTDAIGPNIVLLATSMNGSAGSAPYLRTEQKPHESPFSVLRQ